MGRFIKFCLLTLSLSAFAAGPSSDEVQAIVLKIAAVSKDLSSAASNQEKASKWIQLQHLAEQIADSSVRSTSYDRIVKCNVGGQAKRDQPRSPDPKCADDPLIQASKAGVSFFFFEPGASFYAKKEGYEHYLRLAPLGPEADDAYYQLHFVDRLLRPKDLCTADEAKKVLKDAQEFLSRYPRSELKTQVLELVKNAKATLSAPPSPEAGACGMVD